MTDQHRLLLVIEDRETIEPMIRSRFPSLETYVFRAEDRIEEVIERFAPTIAFASVSDHMPKSDFVKILYTPAMQWFSNGAAGVEHLGKWDPQAVTVTNASGVNARYLAQYTIAAHMSANIRMPDYAAQQRDKRWQTHPWIPFEGRRFCVIGLGKIGQEVARLAKGLGMVTTGTRGTARPTDHVDEVYGAEDLLKALAGSDFVSVHAAHTPETEGLFNAETFAAMKDGAIFLNAARGALVDESALIDALDSGKVRTAILDVFRKEPLPTDSPLWTHPNVIVTPHMADTVTSWELNFASAFADNLDHWLKGEPMTNVVDPARGY